MLIQSKIVMAVFKTRVLALIDAILLGITWIDYVDLALRIGSGIAALVVTWFAVQSYITKKKLDAVKLEIEKENLKALKKKNKDEDTEK